MTLHYSYFMLSDLLCGWVVADHNASRRDVLRWARQDLPDPRAASAYGMIFSSVEVVL